MRVHSTSNNNKYTPFVVPPASRKSIPISTIMPNNSSENQWSPSDPFVLTQRKEILKCLLCFHGCKRWIPKVHMSKVRTSPSAKLI